VPVKIIRRSAVPQNSAAPAKGAPATPGLPRLIIKRVPASKPGTPKVIDTVVAHPRGWEVGGGVILRNHDLSYETGHTKFLLHRIKDRVWYLIREYDEETRHVSIRSQVKFDFTARVDGTLQRNYVVALFNSEAITEPPPEMLAFVNRKLPLLLHDETAAA